MSKRALAEYIRKCIKEAKDTDMVIPYNGVLPDVDCYEFMSNNEEYCNTKMEEGWKVIRGDS